MTSWKLVGAAIKAQRTWSNLSPERKEQVRKAATQAARNAYARVQEPGQAPTGPRQSAAAANAAATDHIAQAAPGGQTNVGQAPDADPSNAGQRPTPSATETLAGLARTHGPRLARQAAAQAVTRSQGRASQLVGLLRRAQQRPSK